ncbi:MAG: ATP-binding protein, partial [Elainellaceae cyanobacterium]
LACAGRDGLSTTVHDTLERIAQVVTIAIDRTMARAELLSRRESLMFRLTNQIRNSLDLHTILQTAVQEIQQLLQIDRCHFLWCYYNSEIPEISDADAPVLPTVEVTHEAKLTQLSSVLGSCAPQVNTILAEQILHLRVVHISCGDDTTAIQDFQPILQAWNVRSLLIVPLETRLGQLGAIVCSHCQDYRHWSQDEVKLLQSVTNQLAIAMEQAELYAQTKDAAHTAQTQAHQLNHALQALQQTQAQLVHSEKMSSLGQLVAGIAHEINNPVNFISGNLIYAKEYFADLVRLLKLYQSHYPQPSPEIQTCIQDIELEFLLGDFAHLLESMKIGSERICQIVLSLRNFSRLDEAEVKAVDIHEGLDSTLLILHHRLKPHGDATGVEVIKNYGRLPLINCYASQLNQVFMNLLSNAIDAVEDISNPRQITITTTTCTDGSITNLHSTLDPSVEWILIHIHDNGKGIPKAQMSNVFEPFFTTKPVGQGTGLGLSISYQIIVEKHHGWLGCTSTSAQGATLTIAIPVLPESDEDPDANHDQNADHPEQTEVSEINKVL